MDAATESRHAFRLTAASAGLQAGMLGAFWMLLGTGLSDVWQQRSFWTAENLMASAFYGERAIRSGFAERTLSGLALYLILYSLLGALLAVVVDDRLPRTRIFLVSVLFALGWYYLSFRLLWKSVLPLVALLHSMQSTILGHVLYGLVLGRYPAYLPKPPRQIEATPAAEDQAASSAPAAEEAPPAPVAPSDVHES
ncbi:MAG TPA: DUF6789 family protein [Bryobacteraceae bacterium]|nr:DUF6789 family protein [Bryobacteraceae bacterium]